MVEPPDCFIHSTVQPFSQFLCDKFSQHLCDNTLKKEIKVNSWKGISWAAPSAKRGKIIPMLDDKRLEKFDELKIQIKSYVPDITGLS